MLWVAKLCLLVAVNPILPKPQQIENFTLVKQTVKVSVVVFVRENPFAVKE